MEEEVVPIHRHPVLPFTRFDFVECNGCSIRGEVGPSYLYGGYRCNELGCGAVYHKECAKPLPEINHSSHPHPLELIIADYGRCSLCDTSFNDGYRCSICEFKLDLRCARGAFQIVIPENSSVHEHPLALTNYPFECYRECTVCDSGILTKKHRYLYICYQCEFLAHPYCVDLYHNTSHPQHPLKLLKCEATPEYVDKKCLLCGVEFGRGDERLYHCEFCNFSICSGCMTNPPPLGVESPTTHEHQLHLVPRRIDFTCNACGTLGDRSPYFCLPCNFMIHRECIDLPRVININRHDHRISYTRRPGHGEWNCKVCRKKVDGFYGAYTCVKCPSFSVHSRCATTKHVWDMVELEGTLEEEVIAPFEVIDENTIKHFKHNHNLRIIKDGRILHENIVCKACAFQICSESFYSCEQCDFILHEKCANLPRKKRHVHYNLPFTLDTLSFDLKVAQCMLCDQHFNGFRYTSATSMIFMDMRCGSFSEPFIHRSHQHPLYYTKDKSKRCSECEACKNLISCDECDFSLCFKCATLPTTVMWHRYDDHPLFLSNGDMNVDDKYWCEACETELNPKKWFYTCNDCGITLHISCVVGDLSYIMPGPVLKRSRKVVLNTFSCRPLCSECNSRCMLPSVLRLSKDKGGLYICSYNCLEIVRRRQKPPTRRERANKLEDLRSFYLL